MTIRVAIVDDQDLVRTGFRMILEDLPDLEIAGAGTPTGRRPSGSSKATGPTSR